MRCLYGAEMYVQYGGHIELSVFAFIDAEPPFGEVLQANGALERSLSGAEKPTLSCYACGSGTHQTPRSFDCSEHECTTCHGELEPKGHNDKNCPLAQCDAHSPGSVESPLDVLLLQGTGSVQGALECNASLVPTLAATTVSVEHATTSAASHAPPSARTYDALPLASVVISGP